MTVVDINCNMDLLNYLDGLADSTNLFFESRERTVQGLDSALIQINCDLEFNEAMCERISKTFTYFKGVLEGNNKKLTVSSKESTSLFSSIYFSVIRNLKIHNVTGSKGLLLADDINHSKLENVELTGVVSLEKSGGGLARTIQNVDMYDCSIDIKTKYNPKSIILEDGDSTPVYFGAYVGVDIGGSSFNNCTVSGELNSEAVVGGFCAHSKGTTFIKCTVLDLTVTGKREVGLFAGDFAREINLIDCEIIGSKLSANCFVGLVVGKSSETLLIENLFIKNSLVSPYTGSSFVGGIAGTAKKIIMKKSQMSCSIYGSFVVAGICPDSEHIELSDNVFDMNVTASGYKPMMNHVYPLAREEFLTSRGGNIHFEENNNKINVNVNELTIEGYLNPFKESFL